MVGTSWGSAEAMPEARVATTCIAACKSCGASSVRLVTSWRTMDRAAAASLGSAFTMPVTRVAMIFTPASSSTGRLARMASPMTGTMVESFSINTDTRPEMPSAKVSAATAVPFSTPCNPSPMRDTKGIMAVRTSAAMVFSVVMMGSAMAPSWA